MKIEKIDEINKLHNTIATYDEGIDRLNELKEERLKIIIGKLKDSGILASIKDIQGVKSAQFSVWKDGEDPNWYELLLSVFTERKREDFDNWDEWSRYHDIIRNKVYEILEPFRFIMLIIE